jgi:hypothetical protein
MHKGSAISASEDVPPAESVAVDYRYVLLISACPQSASFHKSVFGAFHDAPFICWCQDSQEAYDVLFNPTGIQRFWPVPRAIIIDGAADIPGMQELLLRVRHKMGEVPTILLTSTGNMPPARQEAATYFLCKAASYEENRQRYRELIDGLKLGY